MRVAGLVVASIVALVGWGLLALTYTQDCPLFDGLRIGLALLLIGGVAAGLLGEGRRGHPETDRVGGAERSVGLALVPALALAGWSVFLLAHTSYLEPLPSSAAWIGITLLLVVALGAGLLSGWQWWTLLMLPAAFVGLLHLSESLFDSGVECEPYHPALTRGLLLVPIAIGLGAIAHRLSHHAPAARGVGSLLIALPLAVVSWAGVRHAAPINRVPASRFVVAHPPLPAPPSYRGLRIGDNKQRMVALLGRPDKIDDDGSGLVDYIYGPDTVTYARHVLTGEITRRNIVYGFTIKDPSAETPEGVGIADSLALVSRRISGAYCLIPLGTHDPVCETNDTYEGASGYANVRFEGDPIDTITIGGVPPDPT